MDTTSIHRIVPEPVFDQILNLFPVEGIGHHVQEPTSHHLLAFGLKPHITVRHFPDKLPIGVSPDGRRHAFLYLLVHPLPQDFRVFLRRHVELLRALPASIQLLVPVDQSAKDGRAEHLAELWEGAFRQELAAPLDPVTANELRRFWEASTLAPRESLRTRGCDGRGACSGHSVSSAAPCVGTRWTPGRRRYHVEEFGRRNRPRRGWD